MKRLLLSACERPRPDEIEMASTHLAGRLDVSRAVDLLIGNSTMTTQGEGIVTMSSLSETVSAASGLPPVDAVMPAGARPPTEDGLSPADCGCGCGGEKGECSCGGAQKPVQYVYAIGRLGVSFISQTRRDAIWRKVNGAQEGDLKPITNQALQKLFKDEPFQAQSVVWTLSRSEVAMYAIVPAGPFALETYDFLVKEWSDSNVEFISLPGVLAGTIGLYDGQIVEAVVPDRRGMYSWESKKYVQALTEARTQTAAALTAEQIRVQIDRFLGKIYFTIRNRGLLPEERVLNAAATNAFNFSPIIVEAGQEGLSLKDIGVEKSPLSRPGGDYYDVLLTFFDPNDRLGRTPLRSRFTIDVADTVPVMIGDPVTWYEY